MKNKRPQTAMGHSNSRVCTYDMASVLFLAGAIYLQLVWQGVREGSTGRSEEKDSQDAFSKKRAHSSISLFDSNWRSNFRKSPGVLARWGQSHLSQPLHYNPSISAGGFCTNTKKSTPPPRATSPENSPPNAPGNSLKSTLR